MSEYPKGREREPVPHWLPAYRSLLMQVEGQLRERIPSSVSLLGGDTLVPAGKHHRLKNYAVYLVNVLNRKRHNIPKPVIVEAVDYRSLKRSSHSRRRHIVER